MSMTLVLQSQSHTITITQIAAFVLNQEVYTPYSALTLSTYGTFDPAMYTGVYRVQLYHDDTQLHDGTVEQLELTLENGVRRLRLVSRGLTAMLLQNQLEPGLHGSMSLDKLLTEFYTFPEEITWEQNNDTSNYIYVKPNASMWDGIANLTFKLYGRYPFIRGANQICMNPPTQFQTYHAPDDSGVARSGMATDQSLLYSDYYMAGADGTYGTFHESDPEAVSRGLVRTKQLALDQQYLYNPQQALTFRRKFAGRRLVRYYVDLMGAWDLKLGDRLSIGTTIDAAMITHVRMTGDQKGIRTRLEAYDDPFFPASAQS